MKIRRLEQKDKFWRRKKLKKRSFWRQGKGGVEINSLPLFINFDVELLILYVEYSLGRFFYVSLLNIWGTMNVSQIFSHSLFGLCMIDILFHIHVSSLIVIMLMQIWWWGSLVKVFMFNPLNIVFLVLWCLNVSLKNVLLLDMLSWRLSCSMTSFMWPFSSLVQYCCHVHSLGISHVQL